MQAVPAIRSLLLLLTAVLQATFSYAQSATPIQGQLQQHTLRNGLAVEWTPDSTRRLMHVALQVAGGAMADPADRDGLAHYYAQLFFERNAWGDSIPLRARYASRGILQLARNFEAHSAFTLSFPESETAQGLALLTAMVSGLEMGDSLLKKGLKRLASRIQAAEAGPEYFLLQELLQELYGEYFHRKNVLGTYSELISVAPGELKAYQQKLLHPANVRIAGTGAMPADSFFARVEAAVGNWHTNQPAPPLPQLGLPELDSTLHFVSLNEFLPYPQLAMAWPVPGRRRAAEMVQAAADFAALASLRQGRFYRTLVGGGYASSLRWRYAPTDNAGHILFYVVPQPDRIGDCLRQIQQLLAEVGNADFFTAADRAAARRTRRLDAAKRHDLSRLRLTGPTPSQPDGPPPTDTTQLRQFIQTYLHQRPYVAGLQSSSTLLADLDTDQLFDQPILLTANTPEENPVPNDTTPTIDAHTLNALTEIRIYFESSSFNPDSTSRSLIRDLANVLRTYPDLQVYINGYADGQGDGVYNYKLSISRARAVQTILMQQFGIAEARLTVRGFGEAFPEYPDDTEAHRAKNRRVTFELLPATSEQKLGAN